MRALLSFISDNRSSRGVTLLETLVSLLITGVIAVAYLHSYRDIAALSLSATRMYSDVKSFSLITALMHSVATDVDRHRLQLIPRLTAKKLEYLNGEVIPTGAVPDDQSSILYYLKLDPFPPAALSDKRHEGASLTGLICTPHFYPAHEERTFVGITPTGLFEVLGVSGSEVGGCRSLTLRRGKGVVLPSPTEVQLLTIHRIIVAEEVYALLRDEKGQLRRLSFRGDLLIENQPVASKAAPFTLRQSISHDKIWHLAISVHEKIHSEKVIPVYSRLSREHHATILYNSL